MTEETPTLADQYEIQISNTERRNSSIAIQDCYIVYLIECRSVVRSNLSLIFIDFSPRPKTSTNKESDSICVFRRYSDFETLRNYLVAKYSWVIVPVLPEKTVSYGWILIGLNRWCSSDFSYLVEVLPRSNQCRSCRTTPCFTRSNNSLRRRSKHFFSVDVILLEISSSSLCSSNSLR